jgi:FtsH-binding integral membrane protein
MLTPILTLIAAAVCFRFAHRLRNLKVSLLIYLGWAAALTYAFCFIPVFQEFAQDVLIVIAMIVAAPLILFSLFVVITAPTAKGGGKPPEFF